MSFPYLKINLRKISNNARLINDRCASRGMSVVGVTKSILADIDIVKERLGRILEEYGEECYRRGSREGLEDL